MDGFPARYNDGRTARTHDVVVRAGPDGLDIMAAGAHLARWPAGEVRLVDRPDGTGPLRLRRGADGADRLTIDDVALLDALRALYPEIGRGQRVGRATVLRAAMWTVAAGLSVVLFVWVVIPQLAVQVAWAIPDSVQDRIGAQVSDNLVRMLALSARRPADELTCGAPDGAAALDALIARLAAAGGGRKEAFRVRVVDLPLVNAFALPGGHILLPRGMIEFVEGPEELAGILAHEMGHVVKRHPIEGMLKVAGVSLLFSLVVGDIGGASVIVALGEQVIRGRYGQAAEREADGHALSLLGRAGIDARPLAAMFERLLKKQGTFPGLVQIMSTHPPTGERAARFRAAPAAGGAALAPARWRALRKICG